MKLDRIDEYALEDEWRDQVELHDKCTELWQDANRREEISKEALSVIEAEVEIDIRANKDKYQIDKITEGIVKAKVIVDPLRQGAAKTYIMAKTEAAGLKRDLVTLEHRRDALKDLVKMFLKNQFSADLDEINNVSDKDIEKMNERNIGQRIKRGLNS